MFAALAILEVIDLVIHLLLDLGNLVGNAFTIHTRGVFCFRHMTIVRGTRGVLRVAPCFLGRALHLIGDALIGELLVADSIA